MSEEILNKLIEHDAKFIEHDKRFDEHDRRFDEIDKRFDIVEKRLDDHEGQLDFLAKKSLEHDERFDRIEVNMATKSDIGEIKHTLDYLVKIVEKNSHEITANNHGLFRLTERVEKIEKHCGII